MKSGNIKLVGILVALVVIYGIVELTGGKKKSKSLRSELVTIDTAKVTAMNIASEKGKVALNKKEGNWELTLEDGKIIPAETASVKSALGALLGIKPSRMATKNEDNWKDYQVDSSGTRVEVYQGSEKTLDLVIGRFGVQGQRAFHTFVRLFEDKEVYAANDFMSFSVPSETSSYRNKVLARVNKDSLTQVSFNYPGDSSIQLTKQANIWNINGTPADSASVAKYISGLAYVNGNNFVDDTEGYKFPTITATFQFVDRDDIVVEGFQQDTTWVIHSSENELGFFSDEALFSKVFKGASEFIQ